MVGLRVHPCVRVRSPPDLVWGVGGNIRLDLDLDLDLDLYLT